MRHKSEAGLNDRLINTKYQISHQIFSE